MIVEPRPPPVIAHADDLIPVDDLLRAAGLRQLTHSNPVLLALEVLDDIDERAARTDGRQLIRITRE